MNAEQGSGIGRCQVAVFDATRGDFYETAKMATQCHSHYRKFPFTMPIPFPFSIAINPTPTPDNATIYLCTSRSAVSLSRLLKCSLLHCQQLLGRESTLLKFVRLLLAALNTVSNIPGESEASGTHL